MARVEQRWVIIGSWRGFTGERNYPGDQDEKEIAMFYERDDAITYMKWLAENRYPFYELDRDSIECNRKTIAWEDGGCIEIEWKNYTKKLYCELKLIKQEIVITS